jgi:flagellar hook assembly protein FlgD
LGIYNLKGEKVKTLVKDNKNTGNYEIVWDGKNKNNQRVSSGVYLYKMDINNKTHTVKRCVLLK